MDSALPFTRDPHRSHGKLQTDTVALAQITVTRPRQAESERDLTGPSATDDPFTWLPWRPQEETDEDEEHESSDPQDPQ